MSIYDRVFINGESRFKVPVWIYHRVFISGQSRFKVEVCIYHHVFINGESHLKVPVCIYHRVFINVESFLKVAVCLYHRVFINGKTPIKVTVCIYHHVFINGKVISKLRYVYVTMPSSKEKSFQSCGMYISLCVNRRESHFKVTVCIYHHLLIKGKVVSKLRYVHIIVCSSMGKSFQSCGMCLLSCVRQKESNFKIVVCIYHHAFVNGKVV